MHIDLENLKEVCKVLQGWGFTTKIVADEYCRYDIDATYKDQQIKIECKRRRFNQNKYNTTLINKEKYQYLVVNKGWLIITFDDAMICFKNVKDALVKFSNKYCSKTTDFKNQEKIWSIKAELDMTKAVIIAKFDNNHNIISYDNKSI